MKGFIRISGIESGVEVINAFVTPIETFRSRVVPVSIAV